MHAPIIHLTPFIINVQPGMLIPLIVFLCFIFSLTSFNLEDKTLQAGLPLSEQSSVGTTL